MSSAELVFDVVDGREEVEEEGRWTEEIPKEVPEKRESAGTYDRSQEDPNKNRPRWPPKKEGVRPDIEWSMKNRIQTEAKHFMKDFGLTGEANERKIMNSIAKGMSREGLNIFVPKKKMILTSLGREKFYKEEDRFYDSEEETERSVGTSADRVEESGTSDVDYFGYATESTETTDRREVPGGEGRGEEWGEGPPYAGRAYEGAVSSDHSGIAVLSYKVNVTQEANLEEIMPTEPLFSEGSGEVEEYEAENTRATFPGESQETPKTSMRGSKKTDSEKSKQYLDKTKESEDGNTTTIYPEDTASRQTFEDRSNSGEEGANPYFDLGNADFLKYGEHSPIELRPEHGTSREEGSVGEGSSKRSQPSPEVKKCEKRTISRITLVCRGESRREDLGYTAGWTEYGDEALSARGREEVKQAGEGLLGRGTKFDTVLTSSMSLDRETTNLILYSVGQDSLRRYTSWWLNPRHLGDLEGRTAAGVEAQWGWLPREMWAHLGPPRMESTHPEWYRQADGRKSTGESLTHLQARTKQAWDFAEMLLAKGKRSILLVAEKGVVESLLFHALGLQSLDFCEWSPATARPLLLVFERKGPDMGLAAVDFLGDDTRTQAVGLYKAMLERYVDYGILDKYAMGELKTRLGQGRRLPTIQDIYRYKRGEAQRIFEKKAREEGERERLLERVAVFWGQEETSVAGKVYRRMGKAAVQG